MYSENILEIIEDINHNWNIAPDLICNVYEFNMITNYIFEMINEVYPDIENNLLIFKNIQSILLKCIEDKSLNNKTKYIFIEDTVEFNTNIYNEESSENEIPIVNEIPIMNEIPIENEISINLKKINNKNENIYKTLIENSKDQLSSKIFILDDQQRMDLIDKLNHLKSVPQPEQRSLEWYQFRKEHLTASDLGKITKNSVCQKRDLIINKCSDKTTMSAMGKACKHGIKYEDIAIKIYEKRNNSEVLEFGCIPHPTLPHFAASPDGICSEKSDNLIGRMVEIKCPISREITGLPLPMYWAQMQGQLEVADLEYCDFVECKIKEYSNEKEYYEDGDEFLTNTKLEKGVIINLLDVENDKTFFIYSELCLSKKNLHKWLDYEIEKIFKTPDYELLGITWWRLEKYLCTLVKRDRKWFDSIRDKILCFWEEVEYYRKTGIESLESQKKKNKKKEKIIIEKIDNCILLSDDDEIIDKLKIS